MHPGKSPSRQISIGGGLGDQGGADLAEADPGVDAGHGAAVTALLAGDALDRGVETVFLSASDHAVARIYARIGFREIGTAMIAEPAPD